jgi:ethanolamine kinase
MQELAPTDEADYQRAVDGIAPGKPTPNVWTVMQKWIFALPTDTVAQRERQAELQRELKWLVAELSQREGLGKNGVCIASENASSTVTDFRYSLSSRTAISSAAMS